MTARRSRKRGCGLEPFVLLLALTMLFLFPVRAKGEDGEPADARNASDMELEEESQPIPELPQRFPDYPSPEEILSYLKEKYPPTRDQTTGGIHYGSCWAHAAAALCEYYMINHGISDAFGGDGKDLNYSELQLAYLCYHEAPYPANGDTGDRISFDRSIGKGKEYLDIGCNLSLAAQSLMRGNGFVREGVRSPDLADYSHAAKTLESQVAAETVDLGYDAHLKNEYVLPIRERPDLVKEAIIANGAVGISYYSSPKYLNQETNAYYDFYHKTINHVVVVVGWDDSYQASNFLTLPPGDGAYLIRNSHSTDTRWSEESYFWLSYYDTSIGEAAYVYEIADPMEGETYGCLYDYDAQLHGVMAAPTCKSANVYTAEGNAEILRAVQVDASMTPAGSCDIKIYKNLEDPNNPESGSLASAAHADFPFKGRFTVPLENPVSLTLGETFALVAETSYPIDREKDQVWKTQVTLDVSIRSGESFSFSKGVWKDLARYSKEGTRGNLCLRALTDLCPDDSLPDAVPGLSMEKGEEGVCLTWPAAANVEAYSVWRAVGKHDAFSLLGAVPGDGPRTYTDTSLFTGVTVSYMVIPVRNDQTDFACASPVRAIKPPAPTKIILSSKKLSLYIGQTERLSFDLRPADAERTGILWASDDPSVALVTEDGTVKAVSKGVCAVSAYSESGLVASCKVTVSSKIVYELEKRGRYRYTGNKELVRKLKDAGWSYKKVFRCVAFSDTPVYYVYDSKTKARRYTVSKKYADSMKRKGCKIGVAFYQGNSAESKVYELYWEGKKPAYCYTTSRSLAKKRKRQGWKYLGVSWLADS